MVVTIYMKTPDALENTLQQFKESLPENMDDEAREIAIGNAETVLKRYFQYGECLSISVDLINDVAVVNKR